MKSLMEKVKKELLLRKENVATAESCTGGRVASLLTYLPGSSEYYLGGIISYSNSVKERVLGVPHDVITSKGAVSLETVSFMALGALNVIGSDWSLVSSGVAGPNGGTGLSPVGCVWMAIGHKHRDPICWERHFKGGREQVMEKTVKNLLERFLIALRS